MKNDVLIQVAGIKNRQEAEMLVACGIRWLGFPLRLAIHREDIPETSAAEIIRNLPSGITAVLITYLNTAPEILSLAGNLGVSHIQLHGDIAPDEIRKIKSQHPEWKIIKSIIIGADREAGWKQRIIQFSPLVDYFITDTYDPQTGATGATGRVHDWDISRRIVKFSPRQVILAGGLRPENVREAILKVRPAGVDVHTGVENESGDKDEQKVREFVEAVRSNGYSMAVFQKIFCDTRTG